MWKTQQPLVVEDVAPAEVPDELFAELRKHFSAQRMVELTSVIAWENYRVRFDHAFGIES